MGESHVTHGRVRLFYEGLWGAVCFGGANTDTAAIVCRQLGFPNALDMTATLVGKQANLTYWIDLFGHSACSYDSIVPFSRIEQCDHQGWRLVPDCAESVLDYNIRCAS